MIELLEQLHACGERLFDALIENDLQRANELLKEREALMSRISAVTEKPDEAALRPLAASLEAQNARIADALDFRKQAIEKALTEGHRLRRGQASYSGHAPRRKVLRTGLNA